MQQISGAREISSAIAGLTVLRWQWHLTSVERAERRELLLIEVGAIAVLTLMLCQLPAISPVLAGLQIPIGLAMFAAAPARTVMVVIKWGWLLIVPLFAVLSAVWSISPDVSLRYGVQFVFTAFIGVFVAERLGPAALLRAVVISFSIFMILGLGSGRTGASMEGPVLIGLAGSKNQIANAAQILMLAALALMFVRDTPPLLRLWCLVSLPLSAFILLQSNASGPLVVTVAGAVMLFVLLTLQRGRPVSRFAALGELALLLIPFVALGPEIAAAGERFVVDVLGKDPTLTSGALYQWGSFAHARLVRPGFRF